MEKDSKNFIEALGLNKKEIIDLVEVGFRDHVIHGKPVNEAILNIIKKIKDSDPSKDELKMFACGMLLSQSIAGTKNVNVGSLLDAILNRNKKDPSIDLPFNAADLSKSIREELEGSKDKKSNKK